MNLVQAGRPPIELISSAATSAADDLLVVKYTRVDVQAPNFSTTYESINQNVDIKITTVVVRAAPEPVVALYDFIMTTFVPENKDHGAVAADADAEPGTPEPAPEVGAQRNPEEKIRVLVKLAGVQSQCLDFPVWQ